MKDYKKHKAKGVLTLVATPQGVIVQRKKYDQDTGQPAEPELSVVDEAALAAEKAGLLDSIADIDELLADTDAAKKKAKKSK